jgi:hypothetical protein
MKVWTDGASCFGNKITASWLVVFGFFKHSLNFVQYFHVPLLPLFPSVAQHSTARCLASRQWHQPRSMRRREGLTGAGLRCRSWPARAVLLLAGRGLTVTGLLHRGSKRGQQKGVHAGTQRRNLNQSCPMPFIPISNHFNPWLPKDLLIWIWLSFRSLHIFNVKQNNNCFYIISVLSNITSLYYIEH